MKGTLIAIEGIDGAGKTTQVNLLSNYLSQQSIRHQVISFPRYGQNLYADLVAQYLKGEFGQTKSVNPYFLSLAFSGDRLLAKPLIEDWIKDGQLVIANRFVASSQAHLAAYLPKQSQDKFIDWINELEYQTNQLPKADLTIFLKVDPKVGQENALDQNQADIHESNLSYLEAVAAIYLQLSQQNWKVVETMSDGKMKPEVEIHQLIVEIIQRFLVS